MSGQSIFIGLTQPASYLERFKPLIRIPALTDVAIKETGRSLEVLT